MNTPKSEEKFLFDVNVFDENGNIEAEEEIEEDIPPPPPVFSEAELEEAKKLAFSEGEKEARKAFLESNEKKIAATLDVIAREFATLYGAEEEREKRFEREAVELVERLFEHIYPLYKEAHGFDHLLEAIKGVLSQQQGQSTIKIYTHPSLSAGIEERLKQDASAEPSLKITVHGDETLDTAACKIAWDHGGATIDTEDMALKIKSILQESLAKTAPNSHDSSIEAQKEDDLPVGAPEPALETQPIDNGEPDE